MVKGRDLDLLRTAGALLCYVERCGVTPLPCQGVRCYAIALVSAEMPCHRWALRCYAVALSRGALPSHCIAVDCFTLPLLWSALYCPAFATITVRYETSRLFFVALPCVAVPLLSFAERRRVLLCPCRGLHRYALPLQSQAGPYCATLCHCAGSASF